VRVLRRGSLVGLGLAVWELVARSGAVSPLVCPSLGAIGREFALLVGRPERLVEAWYSLYRALAGFGGAAVVGVLLGVVMGRVRHVDRVLAPLFSATYPVPKIALFPLLVFSLGIGSLSKITLVFLECLYPIVVATAAGVRGIDRVLVWSGFNMGASTPQVLRRIVVPAAAPAIFAGFRVALPIALIVVVMTEMIGSADGLGYLVMASLADFRTDRLLAGVLAVAVIGVALDGVLVALRGRIIRWEKQTAYFI
jgi:NitT/TauT family transport system permease protein